jgi:hypothetical protein
VGYVRDATLPTHFDERIDDQLFARCGCAVPRFRIFGCRSSVLSLPLCHCQMLLQVVWLLINSAEVGFGEVVVRMVCFQRSLTQSLICRLQYQHYRKMVFLREEHHNAFRCRTSVALAKIHIANRFASPLHAPPLLYNAIRLRNVDDNFTPPNIVLVKCCSHPTCRTLSRISCNAQ